MSLKPDSSRTYPLRALMACGIDGKTIVLAHDSTILAYDLDGGPGNDVEELGLPLPAAKGLWLFTGTVKMTDTRGYEDLYPEWTPEYAGELIRVKGDELAAWLELSPPSEGDDES